MTDSMSGNDFHAHGDAHAAWEEHYRAKPRVWSGQVNTQLAEIVPTLSGTRALDLGCGEGADALWLAERGWTVVAVDVSPTALSRVRADADARGLGDRVVVAQHDLTHSFPEGEFDLVSAQFLHSTVEMDRPAILRRAADSVAPGGTLLIVDHAEAPPWATRMHHHEFPTASAVRAGLNLDGAKWRAVRVGSVERAARAPDGGEVALRDNVVMLKRAEIR